MANFVKAKFKYLEIFKWFGWMPYLTVQHLVHENLIWVFFSNAIPKEASEEDEDPFRIMEINTYVMGASIQVTQENVATTFGMPDAGLSDEHVSYPATMLILNDNALDLSLYERLLHLFMSHFFRSIRSKHTTIHQIDY